MTYLRLFDIKLFYFFNRLPHPLWADYSMLWLHYGTRGGLIYTLLVPLFFITPYRRLAQQLLAAGLSTFVITDGILKPVIRRLRPYEVLTNIHYVPPAPHSFSFPSGEAAVAAAIVMSAVLYLKSPHKYWLWLWAVLVAFNRVYLGHHYPSDVLAGAGVGLIVSWIMRRLFQKPQYRP